MVFSITDRHISKSSHTPVASAFLCDVCILDQKERAECGLCSNNLPVSCRHYLGSASSVEAIP